MMRRLSQLFVAFVMTLSMMGGLIALSPTASAAGSGCSNRFLTFPTWYNGLTDASCNLKSPDKAFGGDSADRLSKYIFRIALNVIEIAMQLVAYISVGFIIYGGFKFLTSPSDSSKIVGGRKTIQNAIIGLVISFMSIAIINLVANNIK